MGRVAKAFPVFTDFFLFGFMDNRQYFAPRPGLKQYYDFEKIFSKLFDMSSKIPFV